VLTDDKGSYELRMASGSYTFRFSKMGYGEVVLENKFIKIGV